MSILQRYNNPLFAKQYDLSEQGSRHGDIEAYVRLLNKTKGPVLEIGCGTGRITVPLKKSGVDVMGLDLAQEMIKLARAYAKRERQNIKFMVGDAVTFKLPKKFDAIIFPYNSIRQIPENKISRLFKSVARHLNPSGKFIFDFSQHTNTGKKDASFTPWSEPIAVTGTGFTLFRRMKRAEDIKKQTWTITYEWKIQPKNSTVIPRKTTMVFSTRPTEWYAKQGVASGLAMEKRKDIKVKSNHGQATHTVLIFRKK